MGTDGALTALVIKVGAAAGLALAAALAARYLQHGRLALSGRERSLQVLETVSVGQHRALHLVAIGNPRNGGQTVLIGSTPTQITFLAPAPSQPPGRVAAAEIPAAAAQQQRGSKRFSALLHDLLPQRRQPEPFLPSVLRATAERLRSGVSSGVAR